MNCHHLENMFPPAAASSNEHPPAKRVKALGTDTNGADETAFKRDTKCSPPRVGRRPGSRTTY